MHRLFLTLLLATCLDGCIPPRPPVPPAVAPPPAPLVPARWILVDTAKDTLAVMERDTPVAIYHNIAVGSSGSGIKRRQGDNVTPLGRFTLGWVNHASRFTCFLGLNYPSLEYADRGLSQGIIDLPTYERIARAHREGRTPPQDTPLGGHIGIHGVGAGSPEIHRALNWTNGCVALEEEQLMQLLHWIEPGMLVEIR